MKLLDNFEEYRLPKIDFNTDTGRGKYIITGGPGFGITTTVNELHRLGFATVREAARHLIEIAGPESHCLPWIDREAFDQTLARQKAQDYRLVTRLPVFFDRAIPDYVGWRLYTGYSLEKYFRFVEEYPYERTVFMTIPWEEIYEQNENRPFSFDESKRIHQILAYSYASLGFTVMLLPKASPSSRANLIKQYLNLRI